MDKIKVMVADDVEETRNVIKKILSMEKEFECVGEAGNGKEVLALIPKLKPNVILMDINMPEMNGLEATEKVTDLYPSVMVIIMSVQGESEYLKRAMFSGAKEYIIKPFNYHSLTTTIKNTYDKYKDRISHIKSLNKVDRNAKIITFYSSKGGVGKTVLSTNCSITFSNNLNKKTLLIDLDLQFGDISILTNQHNEKTIIDMIDDDQTDSYETIKPYLFKYNKNMDILFAPRNPEAEEYISKDAIEKILNLLKKEYDIIVVDTGVNFNDTTLYILDSSEKIAVISTMELSALKNTKIGFNVMKTLGYESNKIKLIINGASQKYGISTKDVASVFEEAIFWNVPEDLKNIRLSVNQGMPLCSNPKNKGLKIVKAINGMCKKLLL